MKLAWLTDLHLNFLNLDGLESFISRVRDTRPGAVLIGGDTGEARDLATYLEKLSDSLNCPIYFVLGNHDFYGGSIRVVRAGMEKLASSHPNLVWLNRAGVVQLRRDTALIGHDSWADGRLGDYWGSDVQLNDFFLIGEFLGLSKAGRLELMQSLAQEAADHFRKHLPLAFETSEHVICLMHAPPFREASLYQGKISGDDYLPHFASKVVGEVFLDAMVAYPDRKLTVLCGHTHGGGEVLMRENLRVLSGEAKYGAPRIQAILEL